MTQNAAALFNCVDVDRDTILYIIVYTKTLNIFKSQCPQRQQRLANISGSISSESPKNNKINVFSSRSTLFQAPIET